MVKAMCRHCTCCTDGNCTTIGRWSGYCPASCPCEPTDAWDDEEFEPLIFKDDDDE